MISLSCVRCASVSGLTNLVGVFIVLLYYRTTYYWVLIIAYIGEEQPYLNGADNPARDTTMGFVFKNNIVGNMVVGISGRGLGFVSEGREAMRLYTPNAFENKDVNGNLLIHREGDIQKYPEPKFTPGSEPTANNVGNYAPASIEAVGFVDFAGGNLRLRTGSTYQGKRIATDGTDPGANVDLVEQKTAGAITGVW